MITARAQIVRSERVEISPDGRISIHSDAVEMGNGIGTALANRVASHIGGIADEVTVAQVDAFGALGLYKSSDAYTITQTAQDEAAKNPRWVPEISSATSTSIGAHVGTQAAAEAARIVFRFGLWPAALALWGIAPTDPRAKQSDEAYWQGQTLIMTGLSPLPLAAIAAKTHAQKGVTGAIAHAFSRWAWSQATFAISGETLVGVHRRASGALWRGKIYPPGSQRGRLSADGLQPDRHSLFVALRYGRSASKSSVRPGRSASPRPTASLNAARHSFPKW
jgi:CO/xanthine dehydrogenase Mo-binding subunit